LALTLAIPLGPWRTGRTALEPLTFLPARAAPPAQRIWIDTDAACGHGRRTDPDDCLALLALAQPGGPQIAGVSAVAGNAPLEVTQATVRALAVQLGTFTVRSPQDLARALEAGPLTIVALGPLSNIAAVLQGRPDLASKVERLVAVMGRRPGHLFHPAEGAPGATLLGHGPVFSDFNFAQDPQATATVLSFQFPMTLIPYDAARQVEITREHLDRLAARDGAHAWVAERSRAWLQFWNEDIGRKGFYPFDLVAAGYVMRPQLFECAEVIAGIAKDSLFLVPWRDQALLVTQRPVELEHAEAARPALYCPALQPHASSYFAAKQ
jgi:inosine-uridine nucleoside N-ribohydrolase